MFKLQIISFLLSFPFLVQYIATYFHVPRIALVLPQNKQLMYPLIDFLLTQGKVFFCAER